MKVKSGKVRWGGWKIWTVGVVGAFLLARQIACKFMLRFFAPLFFVHFFFGLSSDGSKIFSDKKGMKC